MNEEKEIRSQIRHHLGRVLEAYGMLIRTWSGEEKSDFPQDFAKLAEERLAAAKDYALSPNLSIEELRQNLAEALLPYSLLLKQYEPQNTRLHPLYHDSLLRLHTIGGLIRENETNPFQHPDLEEIWLTCSSLFRRLKEIENDYFPDLEAQRTVQRMQKALEESMHITQKAPQKPEQFRNAQEFIRERLLDIVDELEPFHTNALLKQVQYCIEKKPKQLENWLEVALHLSEQSMIFNDKGISLSPIESDYEPVLVALPGEVSLRKAYHGIRSISARVADLAGAMHESVMPQDQFGHPQPFFTSEGRKTGTIHQLAQMAELLETQSPEKLKDAQQVEVVRAQLQVIADLLGKPLPDVSAYTKDDLIQPTELAKKALELRDLLQHMQAPTRGS